MEIAYLVLITGAVLVGLWVSNILYDLEVPHYLSRKIGHAVGGMGFLISAFLFSSGWWPFGLTVGFTALLWGARVIKPDLFRGVGGSGRPTNAMAEVWFPLAGMVVIPIGWIWLGRPLVAVSCLLFMAWGDCVTGIVRSQVYKRAVKGLWGSVAMLVACLVIAWAFIQPFWVGAVVAVGATITEYICGDVSRVKWLRGIDDNLSIPIVSAIIAFGGLYALGQL